MSMTDAAESAFLEHLFNNANWSNIGDAGGLLQSVSPGNLYVSLHTASPGESGDQTTNEATYTSYARVAVARDGSGWAVAGNTVDNIAAVTFPTATGGSEVITHYGIGTDAAGAGNLLFYGGLSQGLSVVLGVRPEFAIGDLDITAD